MSLRYLVEQGGVSVAYIFYRFDAAWQNALLASKVKKLNDELFEIQKTQLTYKKKASTAEAEAREVRSSSLYIYRYRLAHTERSDA